MHFAHAVFMSFHVKGSSVLSYHCN